MPIMRLRNVWGGPSAPLVSTHYFLGATLDPTATEAHNAHIAVATFWNSVRTVIADDFSYAVSPVVDVIALNGDLVGRLPATNTAAASGTVTTEPAAFQTQGLVHWSTGDFSAGRELVGRTYIPGVTEAFSASGVPDSSWVTTVQSAANALIADANSTLCVWSKKHQIAVDVKAGAARSQWKVLRRRR